MVREGRRRARAVLVAAADRHRSGHAEAAAALRAAHRQIRKQPVVTDVAVRELTDYDRVFGLHEDPDEDLASGSRVDLAVDGEGD